MTIWLLEQLAVLAVINMFLCLLLAIAVLLFNAIKEVMTYNLMTGEVSKPFWTSRTFWFNIVSFVLAVLALPEFISVIPTAILPYIATVNAVGNVFLRFITNTGVTLN